MVKQNLHCHTTFDDGASTPEEMVCAVPLIFRLSKGTMKIIRQNLVWAVIYNIICIPIAAAGIVNPSIAAAAMSLSSNGVLLNSLRLKNIEK